MTILAVMGLTSEQKIVARQGVRTICGGGISAALAYKIEAAIAEKRPLGIVSTGIAGALDPTLKVGDCVVVREVVAEGERYASHPEWTQSLTRALPHAHHADLYGSEVIVMGAADKMTLHGATGARAVDMESHVTARIAAAHGIPFAAIRVVSDTTREDLAPAFFVCMKPDGGVDYPAITRSILKNPAQLPSLIRTGIEVGAAFRELERCWLRLDVPVPNI